MPGADWFRAPRFEKYARLYGLVTEATKLAGAGGACGPADPAVAEQLPGPVEQA